MAVPMPHKRKGPARHSQPSSDSTYADHSNRVVRQRRARRAASYRIVHGDPWRYEPIAAGYEAAAAHLLELGLTPAPNVPALRSMWKARGDSQRLAWTVSERWGLIA